VNDASKTRGIIYLNVETPLLFAPPIKISGYVPGSRLDPSYNFWWVGLDSSHLEKNVDSTRDVFHRMTRLESQSITRDSSQSHFYEISDPLMNKPSSFPHKKWAYFASVMIQIGTNFLFWRSSCAVLHFWIKFFQLAQR